MITQTFDTPFYTGGATGLVPSVYDVALNGRPYLLDLESKYGLDQSFNHQTIPLIRNQADTGSSPSEASINPEDLWRRSQDTWHDGSGQSYVDRTDSDPARFNTSKGVDVWTKWQMSLLNDTTQILVDGNTNLTLLTVGDYLFVCDGSSLQYTNALMSSADAAAWVGTGEAGTVTYALGALVRPTVSNGHLYQCTTAGAAGHTEPVWPTTPGATVADGSVVWTCTSGSLVPTWTTVTGITGGIRAVTTDGFTVYIATAAKTFSVTRGDSVATQWSTDIYTQLGYVKGRLMAVGTDLNTIYNVTSSPPPALLAHSNPDFQWVGFAEGQTVLYAAGYSGDKSLIYSTAVVADGTSLAVPKVAGELPDGEIVTAIQGYLGFLLIGTDKGVRLASEDSSGYLTIGSLIPTTSAVQCFEPQDRFCWYGLTDYDPSSTGLGRVDLSAFTASSTPAYASDLMAAGQGAVTSVVTFQGLRVFAVAGLGVYAETATPIATGTLETGQITYRLPDKKVAMFVDVHHDGLGSHTVALSVDDGTYQTLGSHTTSTEPFDAGGQRGERFQLSLQLDSVNGVSPVIRSWTLRSYPAVPTMRVITAPLMFAENVGPLHNSQYGPMDPAAELVHVADLCASRTVVPWQEGATAYAVVVDDYLWHPHHLTEDNKAWNGTCIVKMKCLSS